MSPNVDHLAGWRGVLPIEHHADDLIHGTDSGESNDCSEKPSECAHVCIIPRNRSWKQTAE